MTELKRVMDTTPRTYNNLMNQSINLSSELGNKVEEVNKAMIGFARQGYNPEILKDLTKTATIASNISELGTEDSMSAITASMRNFNIEAEDSVRIIDRLNEVDNNFAYDTANIASGLERAAATASTFGVTIDELIGQVTAIGSTTRESGRIVGENIAA